MTSPITTTTKKYRAASEFSTKLRAAVLFDAFRFSASPTPPETTGHAPDSPRAGEHSAPVVAIARARPRDFWGSVRPAEPGRNKESRTTRPTQRRVHGNQLDMYRWLYHLTFTANMRAVVFVFVDLSWRRGLCAKKSRRGTAIDKKMTGGRRRRERGAGGRERCMGWPRCEHCDCAALKSAPVLVRDRRCLVRLLEKSRKVIFFHGS